MLSGPAGAGKSTTVQSLAKSHRAQIIEWINPVDELKLASQTDGIHFRMYSVNYRNPILVKEIFYISTEFATVHVSGIGSRSNRLDPGFTQHNWIIDAHVTGPPPLPDFATRIPQLASCPISRGNCCH